MLGAQGLLAGRDLYRATPTATRDLGLYGLIRKTGTHVPHWVMLSKILQTEHFHGSHTGENVGLELTNCMINWGIKDKVDVITSDNASNMTVAIEIAGVQKLGCLAHTLNLASNKAFSLPVLQKVLAKVKSIITFFHESNIATEVLGEKQKTLLLPQHKLISDCKTRWNSTY
jgi:hypothetical protein